MKHIGWCLEEIQRVMGPLPKALNTKNDKKIATEVFDKIEELANTLEKIITNHKFQGILDRLKKAPPQGIRLQARRVKAILKDLEQLLQLLDLYIKNVREIIENKPEEWGRKGHHIVMLIHEMFMDDQGKLNREFEVTLHTQEELEELKIVEKHMKRFLK